MNKYVQSETNQHVMKLIQMGAEVTVVSSQMVYVSFEITEDVRVSYVYNVNKKNKYYLERIRPYPIAVKEFETAEDICNIIKIDVEQFRNAARSHNIHEFIAINSELHDIILTFEDLFLYYNISKPTLEAIKTDIADIKKAINESKKTSTRVYYGKDPFHLKD